MNPKTPHSVFKLPPLSSQKKGGVGDFISLFVATIVIFILLIVFAMMASLVKITTQADAGQVIYSENQIGISNGIGYMNNYAKFVEVKAKVSDGVSLNNAIVEAGYEK